MHTILQEYMCFKAWWRDGTVSPWLERVLFESRRRGDVHVCGAGCTNGSMNRGPQCREQGMRTTEIENEYRDKDHHGLSITATDIARATCPHVFTYPQ